MNGSMSVIRPPTGGIVLRRVYHHTLKEEAMVGLLSRLISNWRARQERNQLAALAKVEAERQRAEARANQLAAIEAGCLPIREVDPHALAIVTEHGEVFHWTGLARLKKWR